VTTIPASPKLVCKKNNTLNRKSLRYHCFYFAV
jgi:hypothetical protein